jgi:hypothetical protein
MNIQTGHLVAVACFALAALIAVQIVREVRRGRPVRAREGGADAAAAEPQAPPNSSVPAAAVTDLRAARDLADSLDRHVTIAFATVAEGGHDEHAVVLRHVLDRAGLQPSQLPGLVVALDQMTRASGHADGVEAAGAESA